MEINALSRDLEAVEDGFWVEDIADNTGDLRLKVRGFTAKDIKARKTRLEARLEREAAEKIQAFKTSKGSKGFKRDSDEEELFRSQREDENIRELLKMGLVGWENLTDKKQTVGYTEARRDEYLTDPKWEPFQSAVMIAMNRVDNLRADEEQEDIEELGKLSDSSLDQPEVDPIGILDNTQTD